MRLSAPKQTTFWIAVILAILGLLSFLVEIPVLSGFATWLIVVAFIILMIGNLIDGF